MYPMSELDETHGYRNTGITLPDSRELFEDANGDLYTKYPFLETNEYEKYDPVMVLPWEEKLSRIRQIAETKNYQMVGGVLIDVFSASAIIAVYDKLEKTKNKLKFLSYSPYKMAEMAFRLLNKVTK
jgi:hypothetical protein